MNRVYQKTAKSTHIQDELVELEVPVDGEIERGSKVFMMNCAGCHSMESSSSSSFTKGPALGLIYNRKIGSDVEYTGYS